MKLYTIAAVHYDVALGHNPALVCIVNTVDALRRCRAHALCCAEARLLQDRLQAAPSDLSLQVWDHSQQQSACQYFVYHMVAGLCLC